MGKHTFMVGAFALLLASSGHAAGGRIIGVIASVERRATPTLQITAKGSKAREVRTDANTQYVKWITHKPLQQDNRSDVAALVEGRCVEVELRSDDASIAKIVRISDEPSGSSFDPCKTRR